MTLIRVLRFPALVDFEAEDRRLVLDLRAGAHGAPGPKIRNPVRIRIRDINRISNPNIDIRAIIFHGYKIFPEYEGNCLEITA